MFTHYLLLLADEKSVTINKKTASGTVRTVQNDLWRAPNRDNNGFKRQVIGERHFSRLFLRFLVNGGVCDSEGNELVDSDENQKLLTTFASKPETFGPYSTRRTHASIAVNSGELTLSQIMSHTGHKTEAAFWEYVGQTPEDAREYLARMGHLKQLKASNKESENQACSSSSSSSLKRPASPPRESRAAAVAYNAQTTVVFNFASAPDAQQVAALASVFLSTNENKDNRNE